MEKKSYMGVQTGKNLGLVISTFKVGKTESQRERETEERLDPAMAGNKCGLHAVLQTQRLGQAGHLEAGGEGGGHC